MQSGAAGEVEAEIVEAMLQCIYTGDPPPPDCLVAMLALADQYAIDSLAATCASMLLESMRPENSAHAVRSVWLYRDRPHLSTIWASILAKFWQFLPLSPQLQQEIIELIGQK